MTDDLRAKALGVLRDGRLRIMLARTDAAGNLVVADVIVHGHSGDHAVDFNRMTDARWRCSCADGRDGRLCSHVYAAEWVLHGVTAPGRSDAPKAHKTKARQR